MYFLKQGTLSHNSTKSILEKLTSNYNIFLIYRLYSYFVYYNIHNLGTQFWQNITEVMFILLIAPHQGTVISLIMLSLIFWLKVVSLCFSTANLLSNPLQLIYIYTYGVYKIGK